MQTSKLTRLWRARVDFKSHKFVVGRIKCDALFSDTLFNKYCLEFLCMSFFLANGDKYKGDVLDSLMHGNGSYQLICTLRL